MMQQDSNDALPSLLVVDDDPSSLGQLSEILDGKGYTLTYGTTGQDALELATHNPRLMLLDNYLPDIDGLDVCRQLKADEATAHIPVIILTVNHDPLLEAHCLEAGAVDFITKPYTAVVLRARIHTHLTLRRQAEMLEALAKRDPLTGAANRRNFDTTFAKEWARSRRQNTPLSVVMVDIDDFKRINDTYGHAEGDWVLRHLVQLVSNIVRRPADLLARYGGEEFFLLLPDTDRDGAQRLAEAARQAIEDGFHETLADGGRVTGVTASFGCASVVATDGMQMADLLAAADKNLYLAKAQGRNRVVI